MYPAIINDYIAPKTIAETLDALRRNAGATVFAGGQSVMQAIKARLHQAECVIDLKHVTELRGVTAVGGAIEVGPMTRYVELIEEAKLRPAYQAINDAAATVADRQVRNRGTIGGSLCWNYLAADMPTTVLALDAELELQAPSGGKRTIRIADFFKGALETDRADDELLTRITLRAAPRNAGSAYLKWSTLTDGLPIIGVAAYVETDGKGSCTKARFAVGGVLPVTRRSAKAEALLVGKKAGDHAAIAAALDAAAAEIDPQGDRWVEGDYRKVLIRDLGRQVVATAFARAS